MNSVFKDFKYAARGFLRAPAFTAVAVLTLGLGIGANTAIFSVVRAVLLRPLPYNEGDRLMLIWGELTNRNVSDFPMSPPDFRDYRESTLFEDMAGVASFGQALTGVGEPEQVMTGIVTDNFFSVLRSSPLLGRGFEPQDATPINPKADSDTPPPPAAIILSHGFWQRRFGADPEVLGRSIQISGAPATIVGVMPPGFQLLMPPGARMDTNIDLWVAARIDFDNAPRNDVFLRVIGRLAPGATVAQAQTELDGIAARLREQFPIKATAGWEIRIVPLHKDLTEDVQPVVLALLGAVGFVLLIACVNVANLLLVRATARAREISIRAALGGSRTRIIRQMLAESVLLSLVGMGVGLLLAQGGIRILLTLKPADLPRIETVGIDGLVLAFTLAASVVAALLFGTVPAIQASRADLTDPLKGRTNIGSIGWQRHVRSVMVVAEVALSLVLLIGAGLMVRSFVELVRVNPGFDPQGVLTFDASPPAAQYPQAAQRATFVAQIQERIAGLPGVETVSGIFPLPLSGQAFNGRYGTEAALEDERNYMQAAYRVVLPGYFKAMRTNVLAGRVFTAADNNDSLAVVVVDEVLARKTWPNESAVGKRLLVRPLGPDPIWVDVIGVVEHQRQADLREQGRETIYYPHRFLGAFGGLSWTVRTTTDPLNLVRAIETEVSAVDTQVPVSDVRVMEWYVSEARASTRFALVLIGVFAAAALLLASVGLYGVLSYVVRQRTGEIGVRMAFGAEARRILRLVVGQGMTLASAGAAVGLIAAFGVTRVMSSMLVGVTPTDPVTFLSISLLFLAIAAVACYLPARRATQVDPMEALRTE